MINIQHIKLKTHMVISTVKPKWIFGNVFLVIHGKLWPIFVVHHNVPTLKVESTNVDVSFDT